MRVLVVGGAPAALCVGALMALDENEVVFAPGDARADNLLRDGIRLKLSDAELHLESVSLYKDSASAGLFDFVLCGVPGEAIESKLSIIRPALAHDSVVIPLPHSEDCNQKLCEVVGDSFVVLSDATISVFTNDQGSYEINEIPRISLKERDDEVSWRIDFISTALKSSGIETT